MPAPSDRFRFFVTCARGTEGALRRELVALRIGSPKGDSGGVWFEGPLSMAMGVCLHARVAVRVLLQLAAFEAGDADSLYRGARAISWQDWLTTSTTLAVHASVRDNAALTHSGFAALKVKDAVVDALRDKLGARPDVAPKDPDLSIVLHVAGAQAGLFLDLAGEALHRRGYRVAMTDAPLKETLAAAVLSLGGVAPDRPFVDPMSGSGTLAIEHALAAREIAPGLRRRFGFQRWPGYAGELRTTWERLHAEAAAHAAAPPPELPPIVAADADRAAVEAARRNAAAAGVAGAITFQVADVGALAPPAGPPGTICTNPPYGERLAGPPDGNPGRVPAPSRDGLRPGDARARSTPSDGNPGRVPGPSRDGLRSGEARAPSTRDLVALYRRMAVAFARLPGWDVVVLSGNPLLAHEMGRKPRISHRLFNGPLEVRLLRWDASTPRL
ncbi:MAG TPA: THUMP domain-containing protein [Polyangia bacterium]|nr:THUMP domain-containing protein [Polyangia bacterium]